MATHTIPGLAPYHIQALRGPNNSDSQAFALNANGEVAGVAFPNGDAAVVFPDNPDVVASPATGMQGALWLSGGPIFNLPPGSDSILYGVNDAGQAVGVQGFNDATQIPILVGGGIIRDFSSSFGPGTVFTDINDSGVICGYNHFSLHPWVLLCIPLSNTSTLPALIGAIGSDGPNGERWYWWPTAIDRWGRIVGVVKKSLQKQDGSITTTLNGFFYDGVQSPSNPTDLGPAAFVEDINDSGQIVGSVGVAPNFSPTIWEVIQSSFAGPQFQYVDVRAIPLPRSAAFIGAHASGINNSGVVVGTCWTAASYNNDQSAFVYYPDGVSWDLNALTSTPGWRLQVATRINDAGVITGYGTFNGEKTAFLLTPVPSKHVIPHLGNTPLLRHPKLSLPELVATQIFGGVTSDGGGWVVLPGGGRPIPVGPWGEGWSSLSNSKRDAMIVMALDEVAKHIVDTDLRTLVRKATIEAMCTSAGQLSTVDWVRPEMINRQPATSHKPARWCEPETTSRMSMGKTIHELRRFGMAQP